MRRIDPTLPDPADDDVFERIAELRRADLRYGVLCGVVIGVGLAGAVALLLLVL